MAQRLPDGTLTYSHSRTLRAPTPTPPKEPPTMGNAPLTERELLEAILAELQKLNASAATAPPFTSAFPDGRAPTRGKPRQGGGGEAAPDSDLDGQWGDPTIRKDPPRWQGQSYAGMPYSEAPADYLDTLAGFLDWAAGKAEEKNELTSNGKPRADYLRKDAARARGWALRAAKKGGGWRPPAPKAEPMTDDDVPFLAVANRENGGVGNRGGGGYQAAC